jgi:ribose-phosphate pyrophosphokinase
MDLHAPQIQGFFHVPVDDLYAMPYLSDALRAYGLDDPVVVAPDAGFAKKARRFASRLHAPLAIADKMRTGHDERAEVTEVIGEVAGRDAILVDDFTASASTLVEAASELSARGARRVVAAVTHAVLAPGALAAVAASPIERLFVTDTVETAQEPFDDNVQVVSVAPLFAEAIKRIHHRESISSLFDEFPPPAGP